MATMMMLGSPVAVFAGMVLFGAGFGVIENATFALLIEQLSEAKASALWNFAALRERKAVASVARRVCPAA
jgi:hypothetical protein